MSTPQPNAGCKKQKKYQKISFRSGKWVKKMSGEREKEEETAKVNNGQVNSWTKIGWEARWKFVGPSIKPLSHHAEIWTYNQGLKKT